MTTYPLAEPATIYTTCYRVQAGSDVLGRGTLAECAEIVDRLHHHQRVTACIIMDASDLTFPPSKIEELLRFLKERQARL